MAQTVKNLPAMWETWVLSLGWEDPLEKGMAMHSRILAWRIPWTEEPGRLWSMGSQKVKNRPTMSKTWVLSLGWEDPLKKGMVPDSTPLQYSCLEYCRGQKNLAGEQPMGSQKVR